MRGYDGPERRKMSSFDQDTRVKISETHANVQNLVKNLDKHTELDDQRFLEVKTKIEFHQKIVYGGIGIVFAIEILSKLVK